MSADVERAVADERLRIVALLREEAHHQRVEVGIGYGPDSGCESLEYMADRIERGISRDEWWRLRAERLTSPAPKPAT